MFFNVISKSIYRHLYSFHQYICAGFMFGILIKNFASNVPKRQLTVDITTGHQGQCISWCYKGLVMNCSIRKNRSGDMKFKITEMRIISGYQ